MTCNQAFRMTWKHKTGYFRAIALSMTHNERKPHAHRAVIASGSEAIQTTKIILGTRKLSGQALPDRIILYLVRRLGEKHAQIANKKDLRTRKSFLFGTRESTFGLSISEERTVELTIIHNLSQ